MTIDLGSIDRASRLRVVGLVDDSVSDRAVPATPAWNAHDVVAHLAGVMNDILSGNMEGAATPPWTAAQVDTFLLFGPTRSGVEARRPLGANRLAAFGAPMRGRNHQTDSMGDSSPRPTMW